MIPEPALTDGVVLLRAWRPADLPQRQAGFADPLCQRFSWPGTEPSTPADTAAAMERHSDTDVNLAIADATTPDTVWGSISLYDLEPSQSRAAIGYWLTPQARGRGAATRALRLLSAWALTDLALDRVELTCSPDNEPSQRVALRCGFVREGVLRSHLRFQGGRRDTMVFSLLPGELRPA